MNENHYVVLMRRYGKPDTYSYLLCVVHELKEAKIAAEREADYRGCKYDGVVYKVFRGYVEEVYRAKAHEKRVVE